MKQPALGKKIVALRKTRRLTQEELVEKCNISIRTIQRIESGEVTPRDYTVKTILAALEYDLNQIADGDGQATTESLSQREGMPLLNVDHSSEYLINHLKIAGISGIIFFILRFFEGIAEFDRLTHEMLFSPVTYTTIKVSLVIALVFFQRGFIIIGTLYQNQMLRIASMVLIGAYVLVTGLDIFSLFSDAVGEELIVLTYAIVLGTAGIIYGLSLYRLQGPAKRLSKLAGILEIIAGCFLLTVILSLFAVFIAIPAELLGIVIIYRAIESVQKQQKGAIRSTY